MFGELSDDRGRGPGERSVWREEAGWEGVQPHGCESMNEGMGRTAADETVKEEEVSSRMELDGERKESRGTQALSKYSQGLRVVRETFQRGM